MLLLGRHPGPAFDPICDCLSERPLAGLIVYPGGCEADAEGARKLRARGAGRIVVVPRLELHNVAAHFWNRGELGGYLAHLIDAPYRARVMIPVRTRSCGGGSSCPR
ncbi:hypothetical protein ACFSZS_15990 [Seohaeicola zhoushanensis]